MLSGVQKWITRLDPAFADWIDTTDRRANAVRSHVDSDHNVFRSFVLTNRGLNRLLDHNLRVAFGSLCHYDCRVSRNLVAFRLDTWCGGGCRFGERGARPCKTPDPHEG